jgi:hypothetical protein
MGIEHGQRLILMIPPGGGVAKREDPASLAPATLVLSNEHLMTLTEDTDRDTIA